MFQRLMNLIRGFFSQFLSGLERENPEALLEAEKENLREQIAKYNQGLAAHAGMTEKLMALVKKLETEEDSLRARASSHLRAGNKDAAGQLALRLQTVRSELDQHRVELEAAEKTYKELTRARDQAIQAAQAKITALTAGLDDLKIKKATAELHEMASGMVSEIGASGDTLNRLEGMIEEERGKAAGRARVAKDSLAVADAQTDTVMKEAEQQALADMALADFAAEMGIALEGAAPADTSTPEAPAGTKVMGPAEGQGQS